LETDGNILETRFHVFPNSGYAFPKKVVTDKRDKTFTTFFKIEIMVRVQNSKMETFWKRMETDGNILETRFHVFPNSGYAFPKKVVTDKRDETFTTFFKIEIMVRVQNSKMETFWKHFGNILETDGNFFLWSQLFSLEKLVIHTLKV